MAKKINDDYTHVLGVFSSFSLAAAEVNRYLSKYNYTGYPKSFTREAESLWKKRKSKPDSYDLIFFICRYDLDVGGTQL